ncbi:MAG TPA: hypothetical protein VGG14_00445 [Candidatus Sulfotelmatobacter sp.]
MSIATSSPLRRPIPLRVIVLCTLVFHGPLLLMQLPANTFDANFHMSMAEHYAHHWFNPWNLKSFAGFSQTTYPPLVHQWIAVFSHVIGLTFGFMLVQGIGILLLPIGIFYFAKIWVSERAASYAAFGSIFIGSLCLLAYQDGQIGTICATSLFLLALPFIYRYVVQGKSWDLILGLAISCTAAAAHHATLLFGIVFFVTPLAYLAIVDYRAEHPGESIAVPVRRVVWFGALAGVGILIVLLPYFLIMLKDPIRQVPIPHASRDNFIQQPIWGLHYWVMPFGVVALAIPYILYKGAEKRLRPLLLGFYFALIFGLGGTTPLPRWLLGRAYEVLTFERFTFWAVLLALPFVGMLAVQLIDRFGGVMAGFLAGLFVCGGALAVAWNVYFPLIGAEPDVNPIIKFLNSDGRDQYRYLTLGYANAMSKIACYTNAPSIDGEYNSARTLPEMTKHGVGQLSSAKFYHSEGMEALSEILKHADKYGLKYIFVHDAYYEPLLTFAGWRKIDDFDYGETTVWTTLGVPKATKIPSRLEPPVWQGIMWGTVPFGTSIVTIILAWIGFRKKKNESVAPADADSVDRVDVRPQEVTLSHAYSANAHPLR